MTSKLPKHWEALTDPYGRTYFHNRKTNETSWTQPTDHQSPPQGPPGYPGGGNVYPNAGTYGGGAAVGAAAGYGAGLGGGSQTDKGLFSKKQHGTASSGGGGALVAAHTFSVPMTFILKEKVLSLSGDSFSVKDEKGQTHYKVEGKLISIRDKKVLCDAKGNKLYRMKENFISLRSRQSIVDAKTGQVVVTLRQKSFIPMMGKSKILIWKGDSDDGEPWLHCKGDFLRKNFSLTESATGREVCSVKRKSFNIKNIIFEKDTYVAQIAAGVNSALMVVLVVAIDEVYRDDAGDHASSTYLPSSIAKLL